MAHTGNFFHFHSFREKMAKEVFSIKLSFCFRSKYLFELSYTARNRIHGVRLVLLLGLVLDWAPGFSTLLVTEFTVYYGQKFPFSQCLWMYLK